MAAEQRLIDANKYHGVLSRSLDMTIGIEDSKTASVMAGTIIACRCFLDGQPTIEARPVVHGVWSTIEDDYCGLIALECSECKAQWWFEDSASFDKYHYCPNCGSQMDGG